MDLPWTGKKSRKMRQIFSGKCKGVKLTKENEVNVLDFSWTGKKSRKMRQIFSGIGKVSNILRRKVSMFWIFHGLEKSPKKMRQIFFGNWKGVKYMKEKGSLFLALINSLGSNHPKLVFGHLHIQIRFFCEMTKLIIRKIVIQIRQKTARFNGLIFFCQIVRSQKMK